MAYRRTGIKTSSRILLGLPLVLLAAGVGFVASGAYDVGADAPHSRLLSWLLQQARDRAIAVRSAHLTPPPLDDPQLILKGAGQYAAMCVSCHLAPGQQNSELRRGLYPQPPALAEQASDPRRAFWIIKHGIKMSAMPAWGASHDDATIWSIVAFLQVLPSLSPAQYQDIVRRAPPDDDMDMPMDGPPLPHGHDHGH